MIWLAFYYRTKRLKFLNITFIQIFEIGQIKNCMSRRNGKQEVKCRKFPQVWKTESKKRFKRAQKIKGKEVWQEKKNMASVHLDFRSSHMW